MIFSKIPPTHPWKIPRMFHPTVYEGIPFFVGLWGSLGYLPRVCGQNHWYSSTTWHVTFTSHQFVASVNSHQIFTPETLEPIESWGILCAVCLRDMSLNTWMDGWMEVWILQNHRWNCWNFRCFREQNTRKLIWICFFDVWKRENT